MVKTKNRRNKNTRKRVDRKTRKYVGGNGELESIKTDKVLYDFLEPFTREKTYEPDNKLSNIVLHIDGQKKPLSEIKKNAIHSVLDQYKTKIQTNNDLDNYKYYSNKIDEIYATIQAKEEAEKAIKDKAAADALKKETQQRAKVAAEALKKEKAETAKAEAEALTKANAEKAKAEAEALTKAKADRKAKEKADRKRAEKEKADRERLEKERLEKERLEAERLATEKAEAERLEKERLEKERFEAERIAAEKAEAERLEKERLEKERFEAERIAAEKAEADKLEAERLAAEKKVREEAYLNISIQKIRNSIATNPLLQLLTDNDIAILINYQLKMGFDQITYNYLNNYSNYIDSERIQQIEAMILVLVGILNIKLYGRYKIVFKGGKGLQMEYFFLGWRQNIPKTDDIDLLIIPFDKYNRETVKNIAQDLSKLIEALTNQIYRRIQKEGILTEGISILPEEQSVNKNIVKISYINNNRPYAILDIDFKEDTDSFFIDLRQIQLDLYFNMVKTDLLYYNQTIDSFIKEKKAIKKKYTDCKCPSDVPPSAVPTTPECEPLCKEKQFILDKFQKYEPLIEEHEKRKTRLNQTQKQQSNQTQKQQSNKPPK